MSFTRQFVNTRKMKRMVQENTVFIADKVDAFVALGGNHDKSGTITKDTIIRVIKNEFELTFDIEELCERVGVSNILDFNAFCLLFDSSEEARSVMSVFFSLSRLIQKRLETRKPQQSLKSGLRTSKTGKENNRKFIINDYNLTHYLIAY